MDTHLLAQSVINLVPSTETGQKLGGITLPQLISASISLILLVAAVVFFFMLVIGGIRWITSGGDKEQTTAARSQLTAALIGLVIVFSAWAILRVVGTFFNLPDLLQLDIPTIQPGGAGGI